jgi:hypothetical protein
MKLNKISMFLAAMALVGCSNEDFNDPSVAQAIDDSSLVQLGENFVLAGVGEVDNTMRTHWENVGGSLVNKFLPIYAVAPTAGDFLNVDANLAAQAVGLCWLGNGSVGTDVYTNYEFYHFGWLNAGETSANFECGELTNGSMYDEITVTAASTPGVGDEADETEFTLPPKSTTTGLNYNSGIYKTDNKAIFGGQYIVYYPYNENFKDAGTIPAAAVTNWAAAPLAFDSPELGQATFRYSAPVTIEGGNQAADFGLKNLSTLVRLRVAAPAGDPFIGAKRIDQVVLFSESQKLLKQANLAADKIAAGKEGAELYASTEGTKTIVANFTATALQATTTTPLTTPYITVLPTTVDDLVAFVHNATDGTWARVDLGSTEFKAGSAKALTITVASTDFKSEFIAVDEASLTTALTNARAVATAANPQTITVIGDITFDGPVPPATSKAFSINAAQDAFITIKGDDIIVPEDVALYLKTNMESDVRVLGKSCCDGTNGGRLFVEGGTINNVTMEKTEAKVNTPAQEAAYNPYTTYTGAATVAAGKTFDVQAGTVEVQKAVEHKGNINIAEDAKLIVIANGDLNFMGSTVVNNGTIEVMKNGKYDMTDANGNATATDGQRMTNNGKFIHNVDAGVGTAVQSMTQNGEYRCRVDDQIKLDDAFLQWTACSVIEMVNTGAKSYNLGTASGITPAASAYKHNGKYIDIEVNAGGVTTFNNPVISSGNGDSKEIQIGNLTVTAGGLDIDYVTGGGKRTLTVNGDMVVKANTTITDSKKITVTENLSVEGAGVTLAYKGAKANIEGLEVKKDIKVSGATFDAGSTAPDVNALNITCVNFSLTDGATATFGNRTDGAAKNLVATGTISNPAGCTFNIVPANQDGNGSVLAWVTCKKLEVGGTFSAARPRVE